MTQRTAVIDKSVIAAAVRDALRDRGLSLNSFPPKDPKRLAASVLESALSAELHAAGVRVVTTGELVDEAFDLVEKGLRDGSEQPALNQIEDSLWEQLGAVIDDSAAEQDPEDARSPLGRAAGTAVRVLDADVLITSDGEHLRHQGTSQRPVLLTPSQWLALADSEVRKHRQR